MSAAIIPISVMGGSAHEPIAVGGQEYRFSEVSLQDLADLEAWIATQLPDPLELARRLAEGLPVELAREILAQGYLDAKAGRGRFGSPEASQVLRSTVGFGRLLHCSLRKQHPDITQDQAFALAARVLAEPDATQEKISAALFGREPASPFLDPKAEAPAEA
jgi:hypothetical protein